MATTRAGGSLLYKVYRAVTYGLSPLINLHLQWRRFRGIEHPSRWRERLGQPSLPRPAGHLLWFHAVSLGEGMAAIPVIKHCIQQRPDVNILMTTTEASAFEVIRMKLPSSVIYQFAPLDTPATMDVFLGYWKPSAIILMESEIWPNLIMHASENGIKLALLNARMSVKSFRKWSGALIFPLASLLLSKFSLIVPLSTEQAIHFQLLQASPFVIHFSGDLKYTTGLDHAEGNMTIVRDLQELPGCRRAWVAASIHKGEEKVMLEVHNALKELYPDIVTIIVPRHPQHGQEIARELQKEGVSIALRSRCDKLVPETNIYLVDTLGELRHFYNLVPIAVIGGSFLPGLAGHNISEAAAAGCAILTGDHLGHFSRMALEMKRLNPLSVMQVSGKLELEQRLCELFSDTKALEARRIAAKQAFHALSTGIIDSVWHLLLFNVLEKVMAET